MRRILKFWEFISCFENIPYVDLYNMSAYDTNERLKSGTNIIKTPREAFTEFYNKTYNKSKKPFIKTRLGIIHKNTIERIFKESVGIELPSKIEENEEIEYYSLLSTVTSQDGLIIPYFFNETAGNKENEKDFLSEFSLEGTAINISPFWIYLSFLINHPNDVPPSATEVSNRINSINKLFTEKFIDNLFYYKNWILDSSFIINVAENWRGDGNPFIYMLKKNPHIIYHFPASKQASVLLEIDIKKDKTRQLKFSKAERFIREVQETHPNNVLLVNKPLDSLPLIDAKFFKDKITRVDEYLIRYALFLANSKNSCGNIILTTDNNVRTASYFSGIPSSSLFPITEIKSKDTLTEERSAEIIEWLLKTLELDKVIKKDDIKYNIMSVCSATSNSLKQAESELSPSLYFFANDIHKVAQDKELPKTVKNYIEGNPSAKVLCEEVERDLFTPKNIPPAKWLSNGYEKSFFNQAVAIWEVYKRFILEDEEGIISVNGPPGTGKTTILKDMIANIITQKAITLSNAYEKDKENIFKESQFRGKKVYLFNDKRLLDYGILVTSANNNAVENISKELPKLSKIGKEFQDIVKEKPFSMFKNLAETLLEGDDSWNLISVALGKKENVNNFKSAFYSFKNTFYANKENRTTYGSLSAGVKSLKYALKRINKVKKIFLDLQDNMELEGLKDINDYIKKINNHYESEIKKKFQLEGIYKHQEKNMDILKQEKVLLEGKNTVSTYSTAIASFVWGIPFIKNISFIKSKKDKYEKVRKNIEENEEKIIKTQNTLKGITLEKKELEERIKVLAEKIEQAENIRKDYIVSSSDAKSFNINDIIYNPNDEEKQKTTPYALDKIEEIRKDVFKKSLALCDLFAISFSRQIFSNISILLKVISDNTVIKEEEQEIMQHLWASLFMIAPVISSTFSSVSNLFSNMRIKGSIGYLIVDESGQAVPYAVLGALYRARKAIIVGDPLQIEPVVTLPRLLVEAGKKKFDVGNYALSKGQEFDYYVPNGAGAVKIGYDSYLDSSVQILADNASSIYYRFSFGDKIIKIGIPLRVHFRCKNPMFSISNNIAYNDKMVHFADEYQGKSRYIQVDTKTWQRKNVSIEEVNKAIKTVESLLNKKYKPDDIFVISPFKDMAESLSGHLAKYDMSKNCGTVHTFQGREAKVVIIVFGGQKDSSILWATQKPNIINVAVTRAKNGIIVIGDLKRWKTLAPDKLGFLK